MFSCTLIKLFTISCTKYIISISYICVVNEKLLHLFLAELSHREPILLSADEENENRYTILKNIQG